MPKFKIMGERTLVEAWTYIVEAEDADQAIEMVEDCPDGLCEGIKRLDDDQCYEDNTEFSFIEEIEEPKPKKKPNLKQMDGKKSDKPFNKTRKKKK
jgi:hypothetical protein